MKEGHRARAWRWNEPYGQLRGEAREKRSCGSGPGRPELLCVVAAGLGVSLMNRVEHLTDCRSIKVRLKDCRG